MHVNRGGFGWFIAGGLLVVALIWGGVAAIIIGVVKKVDTTLEENDTTLSKEAGKLFGNIAEDFQEGVDEAKD